MKHVAIPLSDMPRPLPFYLAMEEYVARIMPPDDYFFMWQITPTVIFGRNQLINAEVNLEYCRTNGINVYRRRSGGGCVFADMSNIMFSYITASESSITKTFNRYTETVAAMLVSLGLNASDNSRNDILINGKKVSGNSFYHLPGRSIVHGTMLYDTDMNHMSQAITPSDGKLQSKGVKSVRSHITTLKKHLSMSIGEFMEYAHQYMCDSEITLTADDLLEIERLSQPYYDKNWIYGNNPRSTFGNRHRIEGVGEFQISVESDGNIIRHIDIAGDFMPVADIDYGILNRLKGIEYSRSAVAAAIAGTDVSNIISGLSNDEFINLLFDIHHE